METKLTFDEELAVSSAITLRILELSKSIEDCRTLGLDSGELKIAQASLKSAFKKINGVDFDSVHHD